MNYQVCWHYDDAPSSLWFAEFFHLKETAVERYKIQKQLCKNVKILTIGGNNGRN